MGVDYIIIEVGVGGRLDTTNVIFRSPTVRVITDIGLDYTELLGNTLTEIAREKANIIHQNDSAVMNQQAPEIEAVIRQRTEAQHSRFSIAPPITDNFLKILLGFQQRNWTLAYYTVEKRLALDKKPPLPKNPHTSLSPEDWKNVLLMELTSYLMLCIIPRKSAPWLIHYENCIRIKNLFS